jgi:hypothetical protein
VLIFDKIKRAPCLEKQGFLRVPSRVHKARDEPRSLLARSVTSACLAPPTLRGLEGIMLLWRPSPQRSSHPTTPRQSNQTDQHRPRPSRTAPATSALSPQRLRALHLVLSSTTAASAPVRGAGWHGRVRIPNSIEWRRAVTRTVASTASIEDAKVGQNA